MVPVTRCEGNYSVMQNGGTRTFVESPPYENLQPQVVRQVSRAEEVGELRHAQNARGK